MIASDLDTAKSRLQDLVDAAGTVVPFTGAGISTECGIPDFRSPGGLWTKNKPIPFDEFLASQEARNESWRRRFAMAEQFGDAKPGRGHRALASLYRAGKVPAVITQNIDNLHQDSGVPDAQVIDLTGKTRPSRVVAAHRDAHVCDHTVPERPGVRDETADDLRAARARHRHRRLAGTCDVERQHPDPEPRRE